MSSIDHMICIATGKRHTIWPVAYVNPKSLYIYILVISLFNSEILLTPSTKELLQYMRNPLKHLLGVHGSWLKG
jgi:hypothetical protein